MGKDGPKDDGKKPLPGDWAVGKSPDGAPARVNMDDVVHAYRWILGREPESHDKIPAHLASVKGRPDVLRIRFLSSPEFARQLSRLGISSQGSKEAVAELSEFDSSAPGPIVFMHIPKTGGTTLHYHLMKCFREDQIGEARHNDILARPLHEILGKRLLSGHFDSRIMGAMPANSSLVTILREPKDRLVSVYRYMKATKESRIAIENQPLAKLAKEGGFEDFLVKAMKLNPAAVDNVYCRTFGGTLPLDRWERGADKEWLDKHESFSEADYQNMFERAWGLLGNENSHVLTLENLSDSAKTFFESHNLQAPATFKHLKKTDDISEEMVSFEPVEKIEPDDSEILTKLTRWDNELYHRYSK